MAKPFTSISPSGDMIASSPTHLWRPVGGDTAKRGIRIGIGGGAVDRGQMNSMMAAAVAAAQPLFTVSQWQELELQVLIYKYLAMGNAIPETLVHHFRNSIDSMVSRYYYHTSGSACYSPSTGKDQDPEPWRCWRSDGKKWRCSKKACPESKYCEFHMHRGCKRPKKPMEVAPLAQSPCASIVTSLAGGGNGGDSFQSISLNPLAGSSNAAGFFPGGTAFQSISLNPLAGSSNTAGSFPSGTGSSRLSICPDSYGITGTELRYPYGMKGDLNKHSLFSKASGNARGLGIDSSLDVSWHLMPSQMSLFPLFKARNDSSLQSSNLQFPALQDPWQASVSSLSKPEQQHSFFNSEFGSAKPANHESQSFQPFFNEWPRTMDMWSDLENERTNQISFSTAQLSVPMLMTSSGFSTTNSKFPNDG